MASPDVQQKTLGFRGTWIRKGNKIYLQDFSPVDSFTENYSDKITWLRDLDKTFFIIKNGNIKNLYPANDKVRTIKKNMLQINALYGKNIIQHMRRRGNCWDNTMAESIFRSMNYECLHGVRLRSRDEARYSIFKYIEKFYNSYRKYSALQSKSPDEFEMAFEASLCVALKGAGLMYKLLSVL